MAFPDDPLGVRVELYLGGAWLDITGDVFTENPITITRGRPDEGAPTDAATCSFILDNTSGRYSPRNPRSDLYEVWAATPPYASPSPRWAPPGRAWSASWAKCPAGP
ncbi:hypothetical protein AB0H77_19330 [Streptomyces sp. NPDC050844]|uniref:hypothetical protein n=1 Tax=Streptomyces sp. NPDC050844 TaxID=3155790 RepID=UPI0033CD5D9F